MLKPPAGTTGEQVLHLVGDLRRHADDLPIAARTVDPEV
jgi:hypothetical protein